MKKFLLSVMLLASAPTFAMELLELPSKEELANQFAHVGEAFGFNPGEIDQEAEFSKILGGKKLLSLGVGNQVMIHSTSLSYSPKVVQGVQSQVYETLFKDNQDALNKLQQIGFYKPEEHTLIEMPSEQELGKILGRDYVVTKSKIASVLAGKKLHPLGVGLLVKKTLTSWADERDGKENKSLLVLFAKENILYSLAEGVSSDIVIE